MDNYMTITARTQHSKGGIKLTLPTLLNKELQAIGHKLQTQEDLDTIRTLAQDRKTWTDIRRIITTKYEEEDARKDRKRRAKANNTIIIPAKQQRVQPQSNRAPKRRGPHAQASNETEEIERPRKKIRLTMPQEQEIDAMDTS